MKMSTIGRLEQGQEPSLPTNVIIQVSQSAFDANATESLGPDGATPPPLNTSSPSQRAAPASNSNSSLPPPNSAGHLVAQRNIGTSLIGHREQGEDSPVMNETLSVIDEHITDMNTPRSSLMVRERRGTNDSSSEYSSHIDHRLSYIAGHETDEEERELHSESEVITWSPEQVADCLKDIGVERRHCEVFKEQEITGEVLLGMDQAAIFMKEFELGLVGRRLRTWHKIKAFQEDVRNHSSVADTNLNLFSADGSDDYQANHKRKSSHPPTLPQIPSLTEGPDSWQIHTQQDVQGSQQGLTPQILQRHRNETNSTPASFIFTSGPDSPHRPSAASVRELNHSRRHSAADFASSARPETPMERSGTASSSKATASPHRKVPSLDRNWTMGSFSSPMNGRPFSAMPSGMQIGNERGTFDPNVQDFGASDNTHREIDHGYASGGETEGKKTRNVLKKRDVFTVNHSRQSSLLEEQRRVNSTTTKRQSRFGSVDSIRDTVASITAPASKLYHGNSMKGLFRNSSINGASSTSTVADPSTDLGSPIVTKLEYDERPRMSIHTSLPKLNGDASSTGSPHSSLSTPKSPMKSRIGLRAISDAVTGGEKAIAASPVSRASPTKETIVRSPARTGSTTPSGASQSLELESTDASSKGTNGTPAGTTPARAATRRKPKKETSAYVRGLVQKSPQEQMIGCDYNGWMKKKSSNLMKTWKPRLFVLRGRRLSYYYSENDTEEKGLIDISSHRVLPADSDFLTGFHATVTGAKASPVSPSNAQSPTIASMEAAAQSDGAAHKAVGDSVFIFKLVPPRAGLSRAVNFTKPTIHYFAVDNITQGRLWMAALMKATIDRDESKPITTTFQQKTISLVKARALRHRPPALMGLEERAEMEEGPKSDETGLNILGLGSDDDASSPDLKRAGSLDDGLRSDAPAPAHGVKT